MKTTILNLVKPIAVVAVGLVGALSTNAVEKSTSKLAPMWGYKHVSITIPCQQVQQCANVPGFVCKSDLDGAILYGPSATNCPTMLFRDTQ
ncbi:hypothetical protein [Flavobacterium granuli]|uniref:NVEALA protein n=1 Tax=Flavobacterium granuli TaxID=280093 RepID=A0ABU1RX23_9FLAO|nr:hypothetical protein [Flavobacterium granuli]MDR6843325.1 hypothetical protein [Flavobacterium granuli]